MRIQLNGDPRDLPQPLTVQALLAELDIDPRAVAVEVNRVVVKRARYADTVIGDGDEVEVVALAGVEGKRQRTRRGRRQEMTGNPTLSTRHQRRRLSGWVVVSCSPPRRSRRNAGAEASANDEAVLLAPGWMALAAGDAASAGATAVRVAGSVSEQRGCTCAPGRCRHRPRRGLVGLGAYESWLGARRLDDAYVLRRIARAALAEEMLGKDSAARLQSTARAGQRRRPEATGS